MAEASSYGSSNPNFYVGMKRLVPTGPNRTKSSPHHLVPVKAASSDGSSNPNCGNEKTSSRPNRNKVESPSRQEAASSDGLSNPSYYVGEKASSNGAKSRTKSRVTTVSSTAEESDIVRWFVKS
ncbi:hypothetical protein FNV43_RR05655 [Rhamnella rubrinervis]|uniref:Uncharacterized protein n=1 Tax=Rhamnella rubrinervis TaxID=2594499 RepID=A0A8K0HLS2_9ROSA|nr:hypothetical protein FNV43_RR05655 [Rhamnella rubrinervis]